MLGGQLSKPATRMPLLFSHPFWEDHPYALPCFVVAGFSFTCAIFAFFCLEEVGAHATKAFYSTSDSIFIQTLVRPRTRARADSNATLCDPYESERARLIPGSEEDLSSPENTTATPSILTHRVLLAIVNFGFLAFLEIALCALLPIFLASAPMVGGLGLSPPSIGTVLGGLGLVNGFIQILFFVPAHEFLGTRNLYTLGVAVFAAIYALMPLISRWVRECSGSIGWQSWAVIAVIGMLCPIENMAFSTSLIPAALDINIHVLHQIAFSSTSTPLPSRPRLWVLQTGLRKPPRPSHAQLDLQAPRPYSRSQINTLISPMAPWYIGC